MKAINISIATKGSKVVSSVSEAVDFISKSGLVVNKHSENHLYTAFSRIEKGEINECGGIDYSFSAGNNPKNPIIYLKDVTGKSAKSDLGFIASEVKRIVSVKYPELDIRLSSKAENDFLLIKGGLNWYWVKSENRHFPIHELWYKSKDATLESALNYVEDFISKHK